MGYSLPRMLPGAVPSARAWTTVDRELRALGRTFTARWATDVGPGPAGTRGMYPLSDYVVPWSGSSDLSSPMWSPVYRANVVIQEPATYLLYAQVRFPAVGTDGLMGSASGMRYLRILLNGTAAPSDTIIDTPPRPGSAVGSGVTMSAFGMASLRAGDQLYCSVVSTHASGLISVMSTDGGGSFLSVTRIGPGGNQ